MDDEKALTYCNRALADLGIGEISSFSDGTAEARIANTRYEGAVEELLSAARWSFATVQVELSRFDEDDIAPLFDWTYAYALPTTPKYLRIVRIARTADSLVLNDALVWPRVSRADFAIRAVRYPSDSDTFAPMLLTSYGELFLEYVGRVNETLWTPSFEECVVLRMKKAFALALMDGRSDAAAMAHEELYGSRRDSGQLGRAIFHDRSGVPRVGGGFNDAGLLTGR